MKFIRSLLVGITLLIMLLLAPLAHAAEPDWKAIADAPATEPFVDDELDPVWATHLTVEGECSTTITFINDTERTYWGDVRINDEDGTDDGVTGVVKAEGPPPLEDFGQVYNLIELPPGETTHKVVLEPADTDHGVAYRIARGPEQHDYSLLWYGTNVSCPEPEPTATATTTADPSATNDPDPTSEPSQGSTEPEPVPTTVLAGDELPKTGDGQFVILGVVALAAVALGGGLVYLTRPRR